jgi:Tfp pilus assembly protein PilN
MFKRVKKPQVKKRWKKTAICDICLIVYGTTLLHAKHQNLIAQPDESLIKLTASELAAAAQRLLPRTTKQSRIALALPGSEFVATQLKLPPAAMTKQNLKNVVNLQLPTLLPGLTEPLLLAVQAPVEGEQTYALWMSSKRAEELWQAFDKVGLFLASILPRPLVVLPHTATHYQVCDEDDSTITCLSWSGNVIQHWSHSSKLDCESPEFSQQLDEVLSNFTNDIKQTHKKNVNDWEELPVPPAAAYDYAFFPPSAIAHRAIETQKKRRRHLIAVMVLSLVAIGVGIYFSIDYEKRLKQRLADLKHSTINVSQLRAQVGEIEEMIGPIKDFPQQQVVAVLEVLDNLIPKDSWIISFQIEEGVIKLEGYSPSPTQLIEMLSKQPHIYNVEQSRDTTQERGKKELRFGISFQLKKFDLEAYWSEYFPDKRQ